MNWQERQEQALKTIQQNRDSEVSGAFMDWLYAHFHDALENLSRLAVSEEDLKWKHFQAVLFRVMLEELDNHFFEQIHD